MEMQEELVALDFDRLRQRADILDLVREPVGLDRHIDDGRLWQATFDAVTDLLFIVDRQFNIVRVNKAVQDLFPDRSVLGRKCFKIFHNSQQPIDKCPGCTVFHSGKAACLESNACSFADRWFEICVHPIKDNHGFVWQSLHICKDITKVKKLEQRLRDLEVKDSLTSLYNRRTFTNILGREYELAVSRQSELTLLVMELDELKLINQECGQQYGDYILQEFSHELQAILGPAPLCARTAGEQFAVLVAGGGLGEGRRLAEDIHRLAQNHIYDDFFCRQVTVSIGVASLPEHGSTSPDQLFCFAENALRFAKRSGRDRIVVYNLEDFL